MEVLEDELKNSVLHEEIQSILSKYHDVIPNNKVIFEKSINYGKTIADCLVIDTKRIIGIELKTSHDNLRRLKKQLMSYLLVCNLVYVYVSDKHVDKVLELLDDTPMFKPVGVISYDVFGDEILSGIVRVAKPNPNYNLKISSMSLLPKLTLYRLVNTLVSSSPAVLANTYNKSHYGLDTVFYDTSNRGLENPNKKPYRQRFSGITKNMSKAVLANTLDNLVTPEQGTHMLCDILKSSRFNFTHQLVMYDANGDYIKGSRAYKPGDVFYDKRGRKHVVKK